MVKMINYFIYAKDYSYSTHGVDFYHRNGLNTLEEFKNDVKKIQNDLTKAGAPTESEIIYLHWGQECVEVDEKTTKERYLERRGDSWATYPETIIKYLQVNYNIERANCQIKLLYIITDGLVSSDRVEACFEYNKDMHYEKVVFHAINLKINDINLSVAAPFFKGKCIVYCNSELRDNIDISEAFDYGQININNFESEIENLKSYVKLKFLRKYKHNDVVALEETKKLKNLRSRLFAELGSSLPKTRTINLETKDKEVFLRHFVYTQWYKNLTTEIHELKLNIEKTISTMINYIISDIKSYSFDALKFNTEYNQQVVDEPIVNVNFTAEQEVEFPDIILEDDKGIPVIILSKLDLLNKIIFKGKQCSDSASFSKFQLTMACPLFLVNDNDISESIGYHYTFNVYKHFLKSGINTEPRTRKPFHGGIVVIDTGEFDKYNDYIISATYFNFKKVNFNVGLLYYVLWKNCENKEWMDRNVVEQFKKYTMRRISETRCKIGLSSLPLDPQEETSLLTALWYCVDLSSCIFKHDPINFSQERVRMFCGVSKYMIEILKNFNYDLDLKSIDRRVELMNYVRALKRIQTRREKVYFLIKSIFKTLDGFLISEIENPNNLYKLNYLNLDHKGMLRDDIIDETVHLSDYVHFMHNFNNLDTTKIGKGLQDICPKTFRPIFAIDSSKSFYTDLVNNSRKVVISKDKVEVSYEPVDSLEFDRVLSLYNLYIHCVIDSEESSSLYPTLSEYIEYISKKKKFREDMVTIFPPYTSLAIKKVYNLYQNIIAQVNKNDFVKTCKVNVRRIERIKNENNVAFQNNDEINKYLISEEIKIKLIKKV